LNLFETAVALFLWLGYIPGMSSAPCKNLLRSAGVTRVQFLRECGDLTRTETTGFSPSGTSLGQVE